MPNTHEQLVYQWDALSKDHPMEKIARQRIIGEKMMISKVVLDRGCIVPTHRHENEQFACIMSGALRFGLGAEGSAERREIIVKAGEVLHLPSNLPHSAEAIEDTVVLDLFSPPSAATGIDRR